jgi:hypothetical protein
LTETVKPDIAVYRDGEGTWYIMGSTGGFRAVQFGSPADIPAPGDFDGDGKADIKRLSPLKRHLVPPQQLKRIILRRPIRHRIRQTDRGRIRPDSVAPTQVLLSRHHFFQFPRSIFHVRPKSVVA